MFQKIYTLRLGGQSNAKLAAAFFGERFGEHGGKLNLKSAEVMLDASGSVIVSVSFSDLKYMKKFEVFGEKLLEELRESFAVKSEKFTTISVFKATYEPEPTA